VAVIVFALITIGFTGYFIPFNSFTLDVVEQNQQRNLSDQNKKLLKRILMTLHLLNGLKEEITRLEQKRDHVAGLMGITGDKQALNRHKKQVLNSLNPEALLLLVTERERRFESFASSDENLFLEIPVCKPVPGKVSISKRYGLCKDPFTGKEKRHTGVDFIAESETPVIATASGTVVRVVSDPIWGKQVSIEHADGFRTSYSHLGSVKTSQGKQVRRGEIIGTIGISGLSTGPHVHYEIMKSGRLCNPEDYFFPPMDSILLKDELPSLVRNSADNTD